MLAVIVTAVATERLANLGYKEILKKVEAIYKDGLDQSFGKGFDAGWESALENRYAVSNAYMRNARIMEMN
jgi:hypothetical protein